MRGKKFSRQVTTGNVVIDKSYDFAIRIVKLVNYLRQDLRQYELARQIMKSGTSIGANIKEAHGSYSKKEFISKIQIAYKEALEAEFWLNILIDAEIVKEEKILPLLEECVELIKLTTAILNTSKDKKSSKN